MDCVLSMCDLGSDSSVCIGSCSGALYSPGNLLGSYESQGSNIFFDWSHGEGTVLKTCLFCVNSSCGINEKFCLLFFCSLGRSINAYVFLLFIVVF